MVIDLLNNANDLLEGYQKVVASKDISLKAKDTVIEFQDMLIKEQEQRFDTVKEQMARIISLLQPFREV